MKHSNICPICGSGHLTAKQDCDDVTYKGRTKSLPIRFSVCDTCGSETASHVDLRENKRIFNEFKKTVDGLLTGCEVRIIRTEVWGLTQQQACAIFGGGPKAFSKYESDDVIQSEAMDKLIRLAQSIPEVIGKLKEFAGEVVKIETPIVRTDALPIWNSDQREAVSSSGDDIWMSRSDISGDTLLTQPIKVRTIKVA